MIGLIEGSSIRFVNKDEHTIRIAGASRSRDGDGYGSQANTDARVVGASGHGPVENSLVSAATRPESFAADTTLAPSILVPSTRMVANSLAVLQSTARWNGKSNAAPARLKVLTNTVFGLALR